MNAVEGAKGGTEPMRAIITKTGLVCLMVAMAPWLSGGQDALGMLLTGFALLTGAVLIWKQPATRVLKRGPLAWSFGLLMAFALMSLIWWSANRYSSALWVTQWVLAGLTFRLCYSISARSWARKWVIRLYLVSAAIFCVVAIGMYLVSQYGRLTGTFYWANPAAAYLLPAIILGIDGMRRNVGRRKYAWIGFTSLFGASFLLADSRATTAVLFVIVVLYLLLVKLSKRFWIHFLFTIILSVILSFGLVKLSTLIGPHSAKVVPGSRIAEAVKGESSSGSDRLYFLGSALEMWFTHPVLGVGAGAYGDVHPKYQQRVVSASTSAHNEYFQVLAELGLVGAVLLAMLLLCLMLGSLRGLVARPELVPLAIGTLGLLMHMGLDIDARYPALLCLVGGFFGLMYAQHGEKWAKGGWKWPAMAAVVLVPIVSMYVSNTWSTRGEVAQANNDYETAVMDYDRAVSWWVFNPDLLTASGINHYTLALGGTQLKTDSRPEIEVAIDRARQAQKLDPYDGQHYQLEGRALEAKNDLAGAEAAFRRALKADRLNQPIYALDLASVLVTEKKIAEAVSVAQSMLALYPPDVVGNRSADETVPPALANLEALVGNADLREGNIAEAGAAADRALKLDPKNLRGRALKHQVELKRAAGNSTQ